MPRLWVQGISHTAVRGNFPAVQRSYLSAQHSALWTVWSSGWIIHLGLSLYLSVASSLFLSLPPVFQLRSLFKITALNYQQSIFAFRPWQTNNSQKWKGCLRRLLMAKQLQKAKRCILLVSTLTSGTLVWSGPAEGCNKPPVVMLWAWAKQEAGVIVCVYWETGINYA